ncbi:MAG TPA: hypothetical protein DDY88_03645 [Actinobacteria bacterium]|nr:hypothetical protein [Actinomycetota bacterium]
MDSDDGYSEIADQQLDALERDHDADLYNAVLDACDLIFRLQGKAQSLSTTIITADGQTLLRLPVAGHPPYKVFWSSQGPRIEAVFPHP